MEFSETTPQIMPLAKLLPQIPYAAKQGIILTEQGILEGEQGILSPKLNHHRTRFSEQRASEMSAVTPKSGH
jgi:hypothetical protein